MANESGPLMVTQDRFRAGKKLRKAAARARIDILAKDDPTLRALPDQEAGVANLEAAAFHMTEAERHRKKARKRREGHGVISLGHGEALGRLHDAAADWHEAQARSLSVT